MKVWRPDDDVPDGTVARIKRTWRYRLSKWTQRLERLLVGM